MAAGGFVPGKLWRITQPVASLLQQGGPITYNGAQRASFEGTAQVPKRALLCLIDDRELIGVRKSPHELEQDDRFFGRQGDLDVGIRISAHLFCMGLLDREEVSLGKT